MKRYITVFLANAIFLYLTVQFINGMSITGSLTNWLLVFAAFGGVSLVTDQIINFLTLPANPLTFFLITLLLNLGTLYAMTLILPGFTITEGILGPMELGIVTVNKYVLGQWTNLVLAAVLTSVMGSVFYWLAD